jgi:hypothetical protein
MKEDRGEHGRIRSQELTTIFHGCGGYSIFTDLNEACVNNVGLESRERLVAPQLTVVCDIGGKGEYETDENNETNEKV